MYKIIKILIIVLCVSMNVPVSARDTTKQTVIQKLWDFKTEGTPGKPFVNNDGMIYVIANTSMTAKLYAIDKDGKEAWHLDLPNEKYTKPVVDFEKNVYVYGRDALLTSIDPNGKIRWRINLAKSTDEFANTDLDLNVTYWYPLFIFATTSKNHAFVVHSSGNIAKMYETKGSAVSSPIDSRNHGKININFAVNWNGQSEIYHISEFGDDVINFSTPIQFFDVGAYTGTRYVVLQESKSNTLATIYSNGQILWKRTLATKNLHLAQREDDPLHFSTIYYSDIENNEYVIFGVNIRNEIVFKANLKTEAVDQFFIIQNHLIAITDSKKDSGAKNIIVFERATGKELCKTDAIPFVANAGTNNEGTVVLSSSDTVSAYKTCAK